MKLSKIAFKNIRNSIKDYTIYFFTLILGIAIFYVFNALDTQTAMINVSSSTHELIKLMMSVLSGVSVFVSFVLGFLIIYASRFMMKRRNKEFGIYLIFGMSKRKISMILFLETLFIGILSLIVGILLGVGLSQLMSIIVINMFEANLTSFVFVFSGAACIRTIIYFSIMYVVVMLFNTISVSKCKLIDLLNKSKQSEQIKLKNPILCIIIFFIAAFVLAKAYHMVTVEIFELNRLEDILIPIAMGCISTFLIFWSLAGLILRIARAIKSHYYRGLNCFTLRQFSSKINTTVFSTTIICLMLFMTICLLSSCLTIKNSMNANIIECAPVDIQLRNIQNMDNEDFKEEYLKYGFNEDQIKNSHLDIIEKLKVFDYDLTSYLDEYILVNGYMSKDLTFKDSLGSSFEAIMKEYPFLNYDESESIMKLSDYNKVAKLYGKKTYSLNSDEYMIVANYQSMISIRDIALKHNEAISVFNHQLKPKYDSCQDGFVEMSSQHINSGIIIVSDEVVDENALAYDYLMGNYKSDNEEEIRLIDDQLNSLENDSKTKSYLLPSGITKVAIKEASNGLTVMVTFIGLYLGVIFLICSAAIIALKELSQSSDNKERFNILRRIGSDEKMINKALFKQIGISFILPLILAIIHSIFGIRFALIILEALGTEQFLPSIVMTAIFLIVIYGGYFLVTYFCSKAMIREKR